MATSPARPEPPLEGKQSADIAIVGGGFTGLWTALAIKELAPQTDVVVLEQKVVGYGGSGRNAGILGETIDHSHGLAIVHFGLEDARKLAVLGQRNVQEMAAFLAANQIDDVDLSVRYGLQTSPSGYLGQSGSFALRIKL